MEEGLEVGERVEVGCRGRKVDRRRLQDSKSLTSIPLQPKELSFHLSYVGFQVRVQKIKGPGSFKFEDCGFK